MELFLTSNFLKNSNLTSQLPKKFNLNVLQKLENGMYLINIRGDNYKVKMPENIKLGNYKAELVNKNNTKPELKLEFIEDSKSNVDSKFNKEDIKLKLSETVDVKILKQIKKNIFFVEIKGKKIEVQMENIKKLLNFKAKVIDLKGDYPKLEVLLDKKDLIKTNPEIRGEVLKLDKDALIDVLKSSLKFDLKSITPEELKRVIQESGNFFENKLLNDFDIKSDNKFYAFKNNDFELKNSIQKIQIFNSLLENNFFSFFEMEKSGIKDGEIFINKNKNGFSVHLKVNFTEIGETYIKLVHRNSFTDVVISSETDISSKINSLKISGLNIHWKKITAKEKEHFNLNSLIEKELTGFEVIA
jgi:hypothetical protein